MTTETTTTYTIAMIKREMRQAGGHWWERDTMAFFGSLVDDEVHQGEGGIFFVSSEKPPHGPRRSSVRKYNPETKQISTIGDFCVMTQVTALRKAKRLAAGEDVTA